MHNLVICTLCRFSIVWNCVQSNKTFIVNLQSCISVMVSYSAKSNKAFLWIFNCVHLCAIVSVQLFAIVRKATKPLLWIFRRGSV